MSQRLFPALAAVALAVWPPGASGHERLATAPGSAAGGCPSSGLPLPAQEFSNAPSRPHDPGAHVFAFDQLSHFYRAPGEFTHRLNGDEYGLKSLSFIITETHPGGGPGLHVHDTEEAHVLLEGTAQYRVGNDTFTVKAPYVARVPAGTPHTFINAGTAPFRLIAVFGSNRPGTTRIGPNPLVPAPAAGCPAAPSRSPGPIPRPKD